MKVAYIVLNEEIYFLSLKNDKFVWVSSAEYTEDDEFIKLTESQWEEYFNLCPFEINSLPIKIRYKDFK